MCVVTDQAANDCGLEPVAYEFFTQAYILYEEEISVSWIGSFVLVLIVSYINYSLLWLCCRATFILQDSKAQVTALHLIIGTLQKMHVFGVENRETLTHKATGVLST